MTDQVKTAEDQAMDAVGAARHWGRQTMMHAMASRARRTSERIDDQWIREAGQTAVAHDESTWRQAISHHAPEAGKFDRAVAAYIDAVLDWSAEQVADLTSP